MDEHDGGCPGCVRLLDLLVLVLGDCGHGCSSGGMLCRCGPRLPHARTGSRARLSRARPVSGFGPLVPADETFTHQITDTFATVAQSDRSWTEKVCAMAAPEDGAVQLAFGMGKYPNRGVLDAYAGVSRGDRAVDGAVEPQAVARRRVASRSGPIRYEVLEPLRVGALRARRQRRRADQLRVDLHRRRAAARSRSTSSTAAATGCGSTPTSSATTRSAPRTGWVEVDGERIELDDDDVGLDPRPLVGRALHGRRAGRPTSRTRRVPPSVSTTVHLVADPLRAARRHPLRRCTSTTSATAFGDWQRIELQGGFEHPDGRREPFAALVPDARRRATTTAGCSAASSHCTMADGSARPLTVTALGDTGFHLGTGLYFGFDGHWHGEWRGDLHVDGEHIADCTDADDAPAASTRSATASCGSTTRSAAASASATCRASSPARTPRSASTEEASFM